MVLPYGWLISDALSNNTANARPVQPALTLRHPR